jgi:GDP-4-dehydro-6-deoxy-D-mannose reductase
MRALVTGARGFVGAHLVAHLANEGDEVVAVDRGDVDLIDAAGVRACVADAAPEVVYHLGGAADVGGSWEDPVGTFRVNANGTLHVLDAARHAGARRVLVVSSADVYGTVDEADLPLDETAPLRPQSPYAASKVAADFLALQAWLGYGLETVRVRAFNHLGPGQGERFVAPALAARIAANERDGGDAVLVGNLEARRDITDVRDVVRAYRLLMAHGEPGEVYNVCSGREVSVAELAAQLLALATRPMRLEHDPSRVRPVDTPVLVGDATRLNAATGWLPAIPLDQTLRDVLDDWRARVAARPTR